MLGNDPAPWPLSGAWPCVSGVVASPGRTSHAIPRFFPPPANWSFWLAKTHGDRAHGNRMHQTVLAVMQHWMQSVSKVVPNKPPREALEELMQAVAVKTSTRRPCRPSCALDKFPEARTAAGAVGSRQCADSFLRRNPAGYSHGHRARPVRLDSPGPHPSQIIGAGGRIQTAPGTRTRGHHV